MSLPSAAAWPKVSVRQPAGSSSRFSPFDGESRTNVFSAEPIRTKGSLSISVVFGTICSKNSGSKNIFCSILFLFIQELKLKCIELTTHLLYIVFPAEYFSLDLPGIAPYA